MLVIVYRSAAMKWLLVVGACTAVLLSAAVKFVRSRKSEDDDVDYHFLSVAAGEANIAAQLKHGGPFGAVIVRGGKIVAKAHNEVLVTNDPTAHAEILAIQRVGWQSSSPLLI